MPNPYDASRGVAFLDSGRIAEDFAWTAKRMSERLERQVKDLTKRVTDLEAVVHSMRVRLK